MTQLSWGEVCARRLARHGLNAPVRGARPADVVSGMCGAHAQVMSAAELSIGLRIADIRLTDVRDALWMERTLVKTRGPRGTVHLLASRDLPMWTGALSAIPAMPVSLPEGVAMTPSQTEAVVEAIADALDDATLTVDELTEAIVARVGPWAGERVLDAFQDKWPRWRLIENAATNRGVMCFGPNKGRKVTYTSPRRWLPGFYPAEASAALADLVKRYLHAYGPATPQQFAQWLNAPRPWATELFDELGDRLEPVEVEGSRAWVVAGDTEAPDVAPDGVCLLPYFDAYTVGCHPRELLFPGRAALRALSGGQAGAFPVLLIGGAVAGVWHQRRSGRRLAITVEPLNDLTPLQRRALDEQVERIGQFLDGKPELTIGPVSVGAHA